MRAVVVLWLAIASALLTVVVLLVAIKPTEIVLISDPGEVVRTGYALTKTAANLSSALALGTLVALLTLVPRHRAARSRLRTVTAGAAVSWATFGLASGVFTFANISGLTDATRPSFWTSFGFFATGIELGRAWTISVFCALVIAVFATRTRSVRGRAVLLLVAVGGMVPLALQGHASASTSHNLAVVSILVHVVAVSVWVGGLAALVLIRASLPAAWWPLVLQRFSTLAGAAFVAVALSGVVSGALRVPEPGSLLTTSYGLILVGKVVLIAALGALGFRHRAWLLRKRSVASTGGFWRLIGAELVLVGVASGLAAVLARSAPPGSEREVFETGAVTAAESLTGRIFPDPWSLQAVLTTWSPDPFWLLCGGGAVAVYLRAAHRPGRRETTWPLSRTVAFVSGIAVLLWASCGALATYTTYTAVSFVTTLVLTAVVGPALIALGRPGSLVRRTVRLRTDGTSGAAEVLVTARIIRRRGGVLGMVAVWTIVVVGSVMPGVFDWVVEDPLGRLVAGATWTLAGYAVAATARESRRVRADGILVTAVVPLALAAAATTLSGPLRLPDWYGQMNPGGPAAALAQQHLAAFALSGVAVVLLTVRLLGHAHSRANAKRPSVATVPC